MIHKSAWGAAAGTLLILTSLAAFQRPFREYPGREYNDFPLPPDYQEKAEWAFARLMYPPAMYGGRGFGRRGFGGGDWTKGYSSWTMDYPRSDRHFSEAMRRLTRIHARSVEQPVNLDEGDAYDWPWLYAVEVGHWELTDAQAKALREFLLRGGFFMCDDFHGTDEWEVFVESMRRVFPDRPIVDLENKDAIFHAIYDLDDRYQVPGRAVSAQRPDLRAGRLRGQVARHLRRQRPPDGGHLPQHGSGRFLGARGQSAVSREILGAGHTHRDQLRGLLDDALRAGT